MILKENGLGSREFLFPIEYDYKNIVSWFTFNECLYIKYDGQPDYRIMGFNLSGATFYLYYCDILGAGSISMTIIKIIIPKRLNRLLLITEQGNFSYSMYEFDEKQKRIGKAKRAESIAKTFDYIAFH